MDWEKITRATYGLFSSVPMSTNYHDKELDIASSVCEKSVLLLQSLGDRFEKHDADGALWLLKKSAIAPTSARRLEISHACDTLATSPSPGRKCF